MLICNVALKEIPTTSEIAVKTLTTVHLRGILYSLYKKLVSYSTLNLYIFIFSSIEIAALSLPQYLNDDESTG